MAGVAQKRFCFLQPEGVPVVHRRRSEDLPEDAAQMRVAAACGRQQILDALRFLALSFQQILHGVRDLRLPLGLPLHASFRLVEKQRQ